ncbi:hypothetical protein COR50_16600 [Chitinophaga caeni]|uniref:Uncharacterized protein n=1 Tax=Chitinophaga caeni TaxID=2029983 RepID=A0A291QXP8_9BACT|nr:hypothetical protein [Chitinophaga caeni]ATL48652.1 hypothetical protein COR50_16600 [Chitinophaga caeni]
MKNLFNSLPKLSLFAVGAGMVFITACSKNNDIVSPAAEASLVAGKSLVSPLAVIADGTTEDISGPGVTSGTISLDGSVYTVENFKQAYSTDPGQPADGNFYWRFSVNEAGSPANYEIKFTGIATGDITSTDSLKYIDKLFSSVVAADWATANVPDANTIGMNSVIGTGVPSAVSALANGKGWYDYYWSAGHLVLPVSGRVLLYKNGSVIVAFDIQSIYEDAVTGGAFPYYHFRYKTL